MKRTWSLVIALLLIIFGGIFGFNLYRDYKKSASMRHLHRPPIQISSATVKQRTWTPRLLAVGSLVAVNGVTISTEVAGTVTAIHFKSGESVKKDAPLVQLDDALDQEDLKNNQAQLTLSQLDYNRKVRLYKQSAISESDYDQSVANLKQASAAVGKTQVEINKKNILAPFSGKTGIVDLNVGQYVQPGTPFVSLQDLSSLYVNFSLPEQYLHKLFVGQKVEIKVTVSPGASFAGKVTAINSEVTENTRNINVQALIPNPANKLYPGTFADVEVFLKDKQTILTLPQTAVSYSLYGNIVYVLNPVKKQEDKKSSASKSKDQPQVYTIKQHMVTVGEFIGENVIIKEGVGPGDVVVASGQLRVQNGALVVINNQHPLKTPSAASLEGQ